MKHRENFTFTTGLHKIKNGQLLSESRDIVRHAGTYWKLKTTKECLNKTTVFWNVTSCSLANIYQGLGGMWSFYLQDRWVGQARENAVVI
jgi:hypothetical protein